MKNKVALLFIICITLLSVNVKAYELDTNYKRKLLNISNKEYSESTSNKQTSKLCTTKKCQEVSKTMTIISSILMLIIPLFSITIFMYILIKKYRKDSKIKDVESISSSVYEVYEKTDLPQEYIKKIIPWFDKEDFLKETYNTYLKIQKDWTNFNYEGLKENLTDKLFNEYIVQLESLKEKNRQNIRKDFELLKQIITSIKKENEIYIITTEMTVTFYDYIIENKIPIKGSVLYPITESYIMTFTANIIETCPYCGAKVKAKICEYCRGKINRKWILSKKERSNQR